MYSAGNCWLRFVCSKTGLRSPYLLLKWLLGSNLSQYHYYCHYVLAGYYMYIETSSPRRQGDNAKLQVSVSGNGTAACLVFYYHMYGGTIGTLNVYSGSELVFNVSGNQGFYWIRAMTTIYLRNNVSLIWFASKKNRDWCS